MTVEVSRKNYYIKLSRKNGFNAFPIPRYSKESGKSKQADFRYKALDTIENQTIQEDENYGIKPILGKGTAIIDLDNKERYRRFAEQIISDGFMVIETGNGWQIPVIGLTGEITKIELFNYNVQDDKIIEIQGPKQYCVGVESIIFHDKLQKIVTYQNIGSDKIYDVQGKDFNDFVDELCHQCNVTGKRQGSGNPSSYKHLRDQFLKGTPPEAKTSNNYFHQAALQCNTDELTREEALEKISKVYDKWGNKTRGWNNIERKVNEVYDNDDKIYRGGRRKTNPINRTEIAEAYLKSRKFYSDGKDVGIWENKDGFLESINDTLNKELYRDYPEIEESDYKSILFKLKSGAMDMPETNKDLIVFPNAKFNVKLCKKVETDEIADMGFRNYNYLPKTKENEPTEFLKLLDNIPKHEHKRLHAGMRSIFNGRQDSRMTIIHGKSRVGKTTILNILCAVIGSEYAYPVDLNIFLSDRATQANIADKRLVVFQDIPEEWKEFSMLKNITGEAQTNIRKFNRDVKVTANKIKIFASANYLPEIKKSEKNAMYTARLSLIHNTRTEPYKEDPSFAERIIKDEGEKIISYIINLSDEECEYEDSETVRKEWEEQSSPEVNWLDVNYRPCTEVNKRTVIDIINEYNLIGGSAKVVSLDQMTKSLKSLGYSVKENVIQNIEPKAKVQSS